MTGGRTVVGDGLEVAVAIEDPSWVLEGASEVGVVAGLQAVRARTPTVK
jgi:hypothetical protein